jgi:hypothetical protein
MTKAPLRMSKTNGKVLIPFVVNPSINSGEPYQAMNGINLSRDALILIYKAKKPNSIRSSSPLLGLEEYPPFS